jgi:hypothetical protein
MLAHKGVQSWYRFAEKYGAPFPNRFLGLESKDEIASLPLHILCARRFVAHEREFTKLQSKYAGRIRGVEYEKLVEEPRGTLDSIFSREEKTVLGEFALVEEPQPASLVKYRTVLSARQIDEIEQVEREHLH